jgi:uncharacterized membrane protein YgdD (TMEM256/DUF423 family)
MWLIVGSLSAALCVVAHALVAHAVKGHVDPSLVPGLEGGLRQHMFHALALLVVGLMARTRPRPALRWAGWAFIAGTVLFSFSLYARVAFNAPGLGAVTPFGGLAFIVGWLLLAWAARE